MLGLLTPEELARAALPKPRHFAKTRQTAVAGFYLADGVNDMTSKLRHFATETSKAVCQRRPARRRLRPLRGRRCRCATRERTAAELPGARAAASWPGSSERGVDARRRAHRRTCTRYQGELYALRKPRRPALLGRPPDERGSWRSRASSASSTGAATCSHDPAAGVELPRTEKRLPRVILTARRSAQDRRGAATRGRRSGCATGPSSRRSTRRASASASSSSLTPDDVDTEERRAAGGRSARAARTATSR